MFDAQEKQLRMRAALEPGAAEEAEIVSVAALYKRSSSPGTATTKDRIGGLTATHGNA
jgi:hypothetical protein